MNAVSRTVKLQILNKKCSIHGKDSNYLNIGNKSSSRRVCISCIYSQNIPIEEVVEISDIINFDPLISPPIFGSLLDDNISSIIIQMKASDKNMRNRIKDFFLKIVKDFQQTVEKILRQSMIKADSFQKTIEEYNNPQNQASKVKIIQEILIGQKSNEEQELQQRIFDWKKESQHLDKVKLIQQSFSTQEAENLSKDILKLMNSMDLFRNNVKEEISKMETSSTIKTDEQQIFNIKKPSPQYLETPLEKQSEFCKQIQLSNQSFSPTSQFFKSSEMNIDFNIKENKVIINNTSNGGQQCYYNQVLSKDTNYLISLIYKNFESGYYFQCGLINSEKNDITRLDLSGDNIYYRQSDGGKMNKIIKGNSKKIHVSYDGTFYYEIHINIKQKLFRICSPNYQNCFELDSIMSFDEKKDYFFAICIGNIKDNVIVNKIEERNEFPNIMK